MRKRSLYCCGVFLVRSDLHKGYGAPDQFNLNLLLQWAAGPAITIDGAKDRLVPYGNVYANLAKQLKGDPPSHDFSKIGNLRRGLRQIFVPLPSSLPGRRFVFGELLSLFSRHSRTFTYNASSGHLYYDPWNFL